MKPTRSLITLRSMVIGFCGFVVLNVVPPPEDVLAKFGRSAQTQIMLGGAKYFVKGKLVDIQDEYYWIKTSTGKKIRLRVTDNTNMFCNSITSPKSKRDKAVVAGSVGQKAQEQHSGFRIGDCPPQEGQIIKAEVTDLGEASFLRTITSESMETQTEKLGMPQDYVVLPVVRGTLLGVGANDASVQTVDGVKIGNLKKVIIDTNRGSIDYGIVALEQGSISSKGMEVTSGSLMPIPWSIAEIGSNGQAITLQVTAKQLANIPKFGNDLSVLDVRGYWELADDLETESTQVTGQRTYQGADRVAELRLEAARSRYEDARDRFMDSRMHYQSDRDAMERERQRWEAAVEKYRLEPDKTVQQERQSQIFR